MKLLKYYFISSMIFADTIENIPFDWSGQFGFVSHNGTILWNKDWSSNQLFFDGILLRKILVQEVHLQYRNAAFLH